MQPAHDASAHEAPAHDVLIVGAGFGGMGAAIAFKRLGIDDIAILEREDDLGGTWHVNHYPGLAVDIASVTYSYSFEPNPYWSRLFAPRSRTQALRAPCRRQVRPQAAHGVRDERRLRRVGRRRAAVAGAHRGGRNRAHGPISGDRDRLPLPAARPGLPGGSRTSRVRSCTRRRGRTASISPARRSRSSAPGATAVQLIPEIAERADALTVFQRTPIWVVPKVDFAIPALVQQLFRRIPLTQRAARLVNTSLLELLMVAGVLHFKQLKPGNKLAARLAKAHLRPRSPIRSCDGN